MRAIRTRFWRWLKIRSRRSSTSLLRAILWTTMDWPSTLRKKTRGYWRCTVINLQARTSRGRKATQSTFCLRLNLNLEWPWANLLQLVSKQPSVNPVLSYKTEERSVPSPSTPIFPHLKTLISTNSKELWRLLLNICSVTPLVLWSKFANLSLVNLFSLSLMKDFPSFGKIGKNLRRSGCLLMMAWASGVFLEI